MEVIMNSSPTKRKSSYRRTSESKWQFLGVLYYSYDTGISVGAWRKYQNLATRTEDAYSDISILHSLHSSEFRTSRWESGRVAGPRRHAHGVIRRQEKTSTTRIVNNPKAIQKKRVPHCDSLRLPTVRGISTRHLTFQEIIIIQILSNLYVLSLPSR